MEIRHSAPRSLGVEKLVYIGDDGATGAKTHRAAWALLAASGLGLWLMTRGKTKEAKRIGTVLAIAPVAVELYYHSRGGCVYDDLP